MEIPVYEITILPRSNTTFPIDANTTRVADHFAHHMFGGMVLEAKSLRELIVLTTDWPLGDIVWPFVWCDRGWSVAVLRIKTTYAARNPTPGPGLAWRPFLPGGDGFLQKENQIELHLQSQQIYQLTVGQSPRIEQSAWELCTQPESSFLIQQAVSRSCFRVLEITSVILESRRIQAPYFAPKCTISVFRKPIHTFRVSWW